jgi:Mg2+-importing ATPase
MVLNGFVAFLDPPKESAKIAIDALLDHGVRTIVLTGDNDKVAAAVCLKVGIKSDQIMMGADVDQMTDDQIVPFLDTVDIWAKLAPTTKARLVRLWQQKGHTVGFLGDGINDAPALRQADVGVSVDTAVDIAKESADIILLEKSLMVLEEGVIEGRRTFGNIVKYIKMAASGNFGNMFSVLAASIFLPFLPMLPIHILVQNLLSDFAQMALPFDKMDPEYLRKPQKWDAKSISRFTYIIGPTSSIFDIATFFILWFVFHYNSVVHATSFQTGWFIVGLTTQIMVIHFLRTAKIPFLQSRAAAPLMVSTLVVCAVGIGLPYTALGDMLGLVVMPLSYLGWVAGIIFAYIILTQFVKMAYIRMFKEWL